MTHRFESKRLLALAALAMGFGCAQRRADTSPPEPSVRAGSRPAARSTVDEPTLDEPQPEACTVERVVQALEASTPWTGEEGRHCAEALAPRCEDGDGDACYAAALIDFSGVGGAARDHAAAEQRYDRACEIGVADACRDLAWFVRDGVLGAGDPKERQGRAWSLLSRACELGDDESCRKKDDVAPEPEKVEPAPLVVVEGANASSRQSEADGLVIEELRCAVSRPLMGIIAVTGSLAQRKRALDKCAPSGAAFVTHFEFENGKTKNVQVDGGTAAQNQCVGKALRAAKATIDSRCGAVILVGKPEGARASLEALRAASP